MGEIVIKVEQLRKCFRVPRKREEQGFLARLKQVFYREWQDIEVLKNISFEIGKGEFIGYIGANGAGKSTTIKLLTGILCPDGGSVQCLNFNPYLQRYHYSYNIGVVFGQKSILEYEVPVKASFDLYRKIYEIDERSYQKRLQFYQDILGIKDYLHIPVRKLSFGQRMRCEIAASLLHQPKIVFLDEPTIGLDASAKREIRDFLKTVNEVDQTTIILTTHDMKDIEQLCKRVIMIDQGAIIYDGDLDKLKRHFIKEKTLKFRVDKIHDHERYQALKVMALTSQRDGDEEQWRLPIEDIQLGTFMSELLQCASFLDLNITEPELEDVIHHIYEYGLKESI